MTFLLLVLNRTWEVICLGKKSVSLVWQILPNPSHERCFEQLLFLDLQLGLRELFQELPGATTIVENEGAVLAASWFAPDWAAKPATVTTVRESNTTALASRPRRDNRITGIDC